MRVAVVVASCKRADADETTPPLKTQSFSPLPPLLLLSAMRVSSSPLNYATCESLLETGSSRVEETLRGHGIKVRLSCDPRPTVELSQEKNSEREQGRRCRIIRKPQEGRKQGGISIGRQIGKYHPFLANRNGSAVTLCLRGNL